MSGSRPLVFVLVCQSIGPKAAREKLGANSTGGTFQPLLDREGNSVKGQLVAKFFAQQLGMDLFAIETRIPIATLSRIARVEPAAKVERRETPKEPPKTSSHENAGGTRRSFAGEAGGRS